MFQLLPCDAVFYHKILSVSFSSPISILILQTELIRNALVELLESLQTLQASEVSDSLSHPTEQKSPLTQCTDSQESSNIRTSESKSNDRLHSDSQTNKLTQCSKSMETLLYQWVVGAISNYDYLMELNKLVSYSFLSLFL